MAGGLRRLHSEATLASVPAIVNMNVNWMADTTWWLAYLGSIVAIRLMLWFLMPASWEKEQWTYTHAIHFVVSFWLLHWNRGSPDWKDQGEFVNMTVWEQIDNGVPWTTTKKFLVLVPILLFLLTSNYTQWDKWHLIFNGICLIVLVLGKLPELHGVRLFGLNTARVED